MDAIHEIHDEAVRVAPWLDAMRRLTSINNAFARSFSPCIETVEPGKVPATPKWRDVPIRLSTGWWCETTALVADHFGVKYRLRDPA